jgi:hypothetical protein
MNKIFYEYYRKGNGNLKGVVMAIGKGIYGWSMCDPKDQFSKERGLNIAYNRALKASELNEEERIKYYSNIPRSLRSLFNKVEERANRYYK